MRDIILCIRFTVQCNTVKTGNMENISEEEPEGTDDVPDTMEDIPGAEENNEENAENDGVNAEEAGTTSDNSE